MTITSRIFWTTFGAAVAAIGTFIALLVWFAGETDRVTIEASRDRVVSVLDQMIISNATLTRDYANWTAAYEFYVEGDDDALYDNLGSGAADSPSFDLLYFVGPDGAVTHAYGPEVYESDLSFVAPTIIDQAVPLLDDVPLEPYQTRNGLIAVDGQIAIIAAGRIQPDDSTGMNPGDLPTMIGVIWLDPEFVGSMLGLSSFEILSAADIAAPGRVGLLLRDVTGAPVIALGWAAPAPGETLLWRVMPIIGFLAVVLILGSVLAGQAAARQAIDLLAERTFARKDPATGVLNRAGLMDRFEDDHVHAAFKAERTALIYIDLNGLKAINDTHGHRAGDAAIAKTAERLIYAVRDAGDVARIGGDEFVALIIDDKPRETAQHIAEHIIALCSTPFEVSGHALTAPAAVGIALGWKGITWDLMMRHADQAMYTAKHDRRTGPVFFEEQILAAS